MFLSCLLVKLKEIPKIFWKRFDKCLAGGMILVFFPGKKMIKNTRGLNMTCGDKDWYNLLRVYFFILKLLGWRLEMISKGSDKFLE